jgi:hypothetical protein
MLLATGALLCALAVIAVALEATLPAIRARLHSGVDDHAHSVKGCTISNGSPLDTGPLFDRQWPGDFKIEG